MTGIPYAPTMIPNLNDLLPMQPGSIVRLEQLQQMQGQQNMLAQMQLAQSPQSALSALQQQACLANAYPSAPTRNGWYHRERAEEARKRGERIIDRMAFWAGVAEMPPARPVAEMMMRKLAAKLDGVTADAERWIGMGLDDLKEPTEQRTS